MNFPQVNGGAAGYVYYISALIFTPLYNSELIVFPGNRGVKKSLRLKLQVWFIGFTYWEWDVPKVCVFIQSYAFQMIYVNKSGGSFIVASLENGTNLIV